MAFPQWLFPNGFSFHGAIVPRLRRREASSFVAGRETAERVGSSREETENRRQKGESVVKPGAEIPIIGELERIPGPGPFFRPVSVAEKSQLGELYLWTTSASRFDERIGG
jgi:hypothetical protein